MLDRRKHVFREAARDARSSGKAVADIELREKAVDNLDLRAKIAAAEFITGRPVQVCVPLLDLRCEPRDDAALDTQLLYGERVLSFEHESNRNVGDNSDTSWAWVRNLEDGYVGWVRRHGLTSEISDSENAQVISRIASPVYSKPNIKSASAIQLFATSRVATISASDSVLSFSGPNATEGESFSKVNIIGRKNTIGEVGYILTAEIANSQNAEDAVGHATKFLGANYLWGGKSIIGLDCSGLVQLSYALAGTSLPRDSDHQLEYLTEKLPATAVASGLDKATDLTRGDLLFWNGHVAMAYDRDHIIHSTAYYMDCVVEPTATALGRIEKVTPLLSVCRMKQL